MDKHDLGRATVSAGAQAVVNVDEAITRALAQLGPLNGPMAEHHERVLRELVREVQTDRLLDALTDTKAGLREHIQAHWKNNGPDQRIRLGLPRWLWNELLASGPPLEAPQEPTNETPASLNQAWPWAVYTTAYGLRIRHELTGTELDLYEAARRLNDYEALEENNRWEAHGWETGPQNSEE